MYDDDDDDDDDGDDDDDDDDDEDADAHNAKRSLLTFFWAECCMAQRLRCPGGRPSTRGLPELQLQATAKMQTKTTNQPRCRLPESAKRKGQGWPVPWSINWSINQGLVGESREHAC